MNDVAERAEMARDLRNQIAELKGRDDENEIIIRDTSPQRKRVVLYSMIDGDAHRMPSYMAETAINKKLPDGRYMFTANKDLAPVYKRGQIKCFLHPESPERPVLNAIGILNECPAETLGNNYSKRVHAQHRHKQEWAMYQDYIEEQKEATATERAERQIEAMQNLAAKAAGVPGRGRTASE